LQLDDGECEADRVNRMYLELASLYVHAEFLQDPKTKNLLLDTILGRARRDRLYETQNRPHHLPQIEAIQVIYDGTPSGNLARQLLVELYDSKGFSRKDVKGWKNIPADFVDELSQLQRDRSDEIDNTSKTRYHEPTHEVSSNGLSDSE
jgi:hypothetical protein